MSAGGTVAVGAAGLDSGCDAAVAVGVAFGVEAAATGDCGLLAAAREDGVCVASRDCVGCGEADAGAADAAGASCFTGCRCAAGDFSAVAVDAGAVEVLAALSTAWFAGLPSADAGALSGDDPDDVLSDALALLLRDSASSSSTSRLDWLCCVLLAD